MERDEAIIKLIILRNMRGEYVPERDDYLFRFDFPLPHSIPEDAREGIEVIEGVEYTRDALSVMRNLVKYQPFAQEYRMFDERYVAPEMFFELIEKGVPVYMQTYYISFKRSKVLEERNYERDGKPYVKEFLVDREGEEWRIILRRYSERPPWRGMAWRVDDVGDVASDKLFMSAGIYLKSQERFPRFERQVGERYLKDAKVRVRVRRYFERNPVIGVDDAGFLVIYSRGREEIMRETLNLTNLDEVWKHVKSEIKGKEAVAEKIGGAEIG